LIKLRHCRRRSAPPRGVYFTVELGHSSRGENTHTHLHRHTDTHTQTQTHTYFLSLQNPSHCASPVVKQSFILVKSKINWSQLAAARERERERRASNKHVSVYVCEREGGS